MYIVKDIVDIIFIILFLDNKVFIFCICVDEIYLFCVVFNIVFIDFFWKIIVNNIFNIVFIISFGIVGILNIINLIIIVGVNNNIGDKVLNVEFNVDLINFICFIFSVWFEYFILIIL